MPIKLPSVLSESNSNQDVVDIVQYMAKPEMKDQVIYENLLNYPKNCSLQFNGYKGMEDYQRLKVDIIACASKYGSELALTIIDEYKACGNK